MAHLSTVTDIEGKANQRWILPREKGLIVPFLRELELISHISIVLDIVEEKENQPEVASPPTSSSTASVFAVG
jgi:hypothetical protein